MFRQVLMMVVLTLVLTACGGAAATPTQAPATQAPAVTEAPAFPLVSSTQPFETPNLSDGTETSTSVPTSTPAITQTPTDLPTLEIPTQVTNAPAQMVWDGAPTYLGDSQPGYDFRVTYDSSLWAVTADQFGFPSLAHRNIPNCVISVTSGRGLPQNVTVEHDVLYTDNVTFDVGLASENGVKKFVTYTGGDKERLIVTGFEVSFDEQADQCIADAVTVLSTLRAVPVAEATPQP